MTEAEALRWIGLLNATFHSNGVPYMVGWETANGFALRRMETTETEEPVAQNDIRFAYDAGFSDPTYYEDPQEILKIVSAEMGEDFTHLGSEIQ